MTASNLGVVFGPSLMRSPVINLSNELAESHLKCVLIEFLINNCEDIFGPESFK